MFSLSKGSDIWTLHFEELQNGSRIKLGREPAGRDERILGFLEEIRRATDIAGAEPA